MQPYIDQLIQDGYFAGVPKEVVYAIAMVLAAFIVLSVFVAPLAGVTSWLERRVWARMQSRVGPNRVGPQGFFSGWPTASRFLKEDIIPTEADAKPFRVAPYLVFIGISLTFVVMPFRRHLIVSRSRIGILYVLAVTSLVVVVISHGRLGVEQQVVVARRHALGGADRQLRDARRWRCSPSLCCRDAEHAEHRQGPRLGAVGLVPLPQSVHVRRLLPLVHGALWPKVTARRSICLKPSRSWSPATSPNTAACVSLFFFFAEWGNIYVIGAVATTLFLGGWRFPLSPVIRCFSACFSLLSSF